MKKMILASTSTVHGSSYLQYLLPVLKSHFMDVDEILFIPFARPGGISHEEYTSRVREAFQVLDIAVRGLHEFENPKKAIEQASGIFTGGGNTFLLVDALYKRDLMPALRKVLFNGIPYLGTSAGSNIAGVTMQTTNDMPIVHPASFKTLGTISFNINAHYLDPIKDGTHMGETRETRIREFHEFNSIPVVGLREGSRIEVYGDSCKLGGKLSARVFQQGKEAFELAAGEEFVF